MRLSRRWAWAIAPFVLGSVFVTAGAQQSASVPVHGQAPSVEDRIQQLEARVATLEAKVAANTAAPAPVVSAPPAPAPLNLVRQSLIDARFTPQSPETRFKLWNEKPTQGLRGNLEFCATLWDGDTLGANSLEAMITAENYLPPVVFQVGTSAPRCREIFVVDATDIKVTTTGGSWRLTVAWISATNPNYTGVGIENTTGPNPLSPVSEP